MSAQCEVTAKRAYGNVMDVFERYLTLWVAMCMGIGIAVGKLFPGVIDVLRGLEFGGGWSLLRSGARGSGDRC